MKRHKVVSNKNLPMRLPIFPTITLWLLLDRLDAAVWVWSVVGTLWVILWIVAAITCWLQELTELKELQ